MRIEDFNFFGLTIDQHMPLNAHIQKYQIKSLGIMNRLKWYLPQHISNTIYKSVIVPHINSKFGDLNLADYYKLQKRAVRVISSGKYDAHTERLFKSLNPFESWRYFQNQSSEILLEIFTKSITTICSPKVLIHTIMKLDNNQFKFFIDEIRSRAEMHKAFATGNRKKHSGISEKMTAHPFSVFSICKRDMISNFSKHSHIENCYISHKQNWASFHWFIIFSILDEIVRMTMTLSIHVSISLFSLFCFLVVYFISSNPYK